MVRLVAVLALLALAGCRIETRTDAPAPEAAGPVATSGAEDAGVTVYLTAWCPYCRAAREYLDGQGIAYRPVDIESGPEAYAEYEGQGGTGSIPLIVVGEDKMQGFEENALASLLERNGID